MTAEICRGKFLGVIDKSLQRTKKKKKTAKRREIVLTQNVVQWYQRSTLNMIAMFGTHVKHVCLVFV